MDSKLAIEMQNQLNLKHHVMKINNFHPKFGYIGYLGLINSNNSNVSHYKQQAKLNETPIKSININPRRLDYCYK